MRIGKKLSYYRGKWRGHTPTHHAVPFGKIDGGGRIAQFDPNHATFDLGRWPEIIPPHLH